MSELREIYDQDQEDRKKRLWEQDLSLMVKRDAERLARVIEVVEVGQLRTGEDHVCAAMILQHGSEVKHYEMAHELAKKAAKMGYIPKTKEDPDPWWLAAAAKDRALMRQGKPQLYGTQFKKDSEDGPWYLWEVDLSVTDEERTRWHVPPLAETRARAKKMNEKQEP